MKKAVIMAGILVLVPGLAVERAPGSTEEEWVEMILKYRGHPTIVLKTPPVVTIMIPDPKTLDPERPVALDVRPRTGFPSP